MDSKEDPKNLVSIQAKSKDPVNQGMLLPKIHKLFIKGSKPAIRDYYDKLDDALFDMAEKAQNNELQTQYFEAMREVRKKKDLMVRKFSENVQQVFKQFKQGKFDYFEQTTSTQTETTDGLSLVEEQELDQKLAVNNLIEKANTYLHQQLYALEKRFTLLAGGSEIKINQVPVSPAVIVGSFAATFEHLNIDDTIHLIMLKLFERSLIHNLNDTYQDINRSLIDAGILPNLKFKIARRGSARMPSPGAPTDHPISPEELAEQMVPVDASQTPHGGVVTDAHYQAITSALTQRHSHSPPQAGMSLFDATVISNALDLLRVNELNSLNARQASMSPTEIKDALLEQLRQLDQDGEQKQVKQQDEDTIDLVGMLFQFLVDDRNLPDKIQALLAKLQIPYLHLALKDRKLFANKENNARKLLDIIAKASIGWNEKDDKRGHFINKIEEIVQTILESDHDEIDFPKLIEDFKAFEDKNKKRTQVIEKRTSEKALGQERITKAKVQTAAILKEKMASHRLPKLVTELLLTPWANVLILAHLRHQDEPDQIELFVSLVDKLIFVAVKDKKRQATNAQISHVCDQLSKGLRLVAFDELSIKEKISELYQLLLEINGIEDSKDDVDHEFVLPQETFEQQEEDQDQPEIVHFIANKKLNNPNQDVSHVEDQYYEQAKSLQTGEWVDFKADDEQDESVRAKLSWVSPISQKMLFVNARGVKVTDKSVDELAHDLREKQAVILQQIPLFDRAMSAIAKQVKVGDETAKSGAESHESTAPSKTSEEDQSPTA